MSRRTPSPQDALPILGTREALRVLIRLPPAPIRKNSKPPSNAPTPSARRCAASSSPPPAQPRRNCSPIFDRCGGGRKSVYVRRDARSVSGGGSDQIGRAHV